MLGYTPQVVPQCVISENLKIRLMDEILCLLKEHMNHVKNERSKTHLSANVSTPESET